MSISLVFAKIKTLTPVAIVGTAVLITIKLLTTQTPIVKDSLTVNVEEDIAKVSYEDEIKEPEIEEVAKEEEEEAPEETPLEEDQDEEEEEDAVEDASDGESQEQEASQEQQQQEKEKQKSRKFRTDISLGTVFQKLFSKKG